MSDINFQCSKCSQSIDAPDELAGHLVDCPTCNETIEVPTGTSSIGPGPASPPHITDDLSQFIEDEQDPVVVQKLLRRVQDLLTKAESIQYIGVQKKPIVTLSPDAVVLTNFRFMIVRPKLMGMTFEDFPWREVADVHMSEQLLGATITCMTTSRRHSSIDSIPKKQARRIYSYAQEVEERAHFARRDAELERLRASAGGVVVHASSQAVPPLHQLPALQDDPVVILSKLKKMLEGGLIEQAEFDAKKAEILSRM
jgi:ribosomal protein S19